LREDLSAARSSVWTALLWWTALLLLAGGAFPVWEMTVERGDQPWLSSFVKAGGRRLGEENEGGD
jgi:hypothetical protein